MVCWQQQWFKFRFKFPFPPHHLWPLDSAKFSCAHLNLISFLEKLRPIWGLLNLRCGIPTKSPWLVKNTKSWSNNWTIYMDLWHGYQSKSGFWIVMMFAIHLAMVCHGIPSIITQTHPYCIHIAMDLLLVTLKVKPA